MPESLRGRVWWSGPDFLAIRFPQLPWVLPGWIPGYNYTLLFGESKLGKSILAAQISQALELGPGHPVIGIDTPVQIPVLYVQADQPAPEWHEELARIMPDARFAIATPRNGWADSEGWRQAIKTAAAECKAGFVWFDSADAATVELNIGHKGECQRLLARLKQAANGQPFGLIHHPRRLAPGEKRQVGSYNARDRYAGSRYLYSQASSIIMLEGEPQEPTGQAIVSNRATLETVYELDRDELGRWVKPSPRLAGRPPTGRAVIAGFPELA